MKDIRDIRADFPILSRTVYGKPLVYLDNGATTQKPGVVIETLERLYREENSNIHRGVHHLSERMTSLYEETRHKVQHFIGAARPQEIVFTAGTTAAINLVAYSFGERFVGEGDEIIITAMEHHANIVPWQMLCERKGARLRVLPVDGRGELRIELLDTLFSERTRLMAVTQVSNVLGTVNPMREIIAKAHAAGVPVLVDGAQGVQHGVTDVRQLDCDFYVFSGHKIYAPTGIGVLYAKEKWLEAMPPWQGGGDMIRRVTFEKTTYQDPPLKFEAGTMNYAGAIALGAALDYLSSLGMEEIRERENELTQYATRRLEEIPGLRIYGNATEKISVISFLVGEIHPSDMGMILDKLGIAVRTGHHCAEPLIDHYSIPGTVRASMAFYNTQEEIDILVEGVKKAVEMLG